MKMFSTESQISTKIVYSSEIMFSFKGYNSCLKFLRLTNFRQYFDETISYLLFHWNEKGVAEIAQ